MKEIPSLSRLLDKYLNVEVTDDPVTTRDHMLQATFSIPSEDYANMTADELKLLYLNPLMQAFAEEINAMGKVRVAELPMPPKLPAISCTNGTIPVMIVIVRRDNPDRHQFLISILVERA